MQEMSSFDKNANLNSGENIDFAVIAPGTPIPNGFELTFKGLG